jgi:regulator of cell morphogenesis and NO signaling
MKGAQGKTKFYEMSLDKLAAYLIDIEYPFLQKALSTFILSVRTIRESDARSEARSLAIIMERVAQVTGRHFEMLRHELFPYFMVGTERANATAPAALPGVILDIQLDHSLIESLFSEGHSISREYTPPAEATPALKLCYAQLFNFEQDMIRHIFLQKEILFPKLRERFHLPSPHKK